jgi:hypothetical protein
MEHPKLTSDRAERIINLLRDNPGLSLTLSDIADATGIPIDELADHLVDLVGRMMLIGEQTPDGVDVYRFPEAYQRGTLAP